jgi:hypothetical protein
MITLVLITRPRIKTMEKDSQLVAQIGQYEAEGFYDKARTCRRKMLERAAAAEHQEFVSLCEFLVREKITVRGIESAVADEPFYKRLHDMVCQKLGNNHILAAQAKRKRPKWP